MTPAIQDRALRDLVEGATRWRVWTMLGWLDIVRRYRRSLIGPFWLTLSTAVWIGSMGLVSATLFRQDMATIFPFVTAGVIAWVMVQGVLIESCVLFINSRAILTGLQLPYSVPVYRLAWRELIVFFHNLIIFVIVAAIYSVHPTWATLLVIPGLALGFVNACWIGIFFGIFGTRYRDLQPIVQNLLMMAFFVTPIFWPRHLLGNKPYFADINPFYHFLEIIRAPLLGQVPAPLTYAVVGVITVVGWAAAILMFRRCRDRITYWL